MMVIGADSKGELSFRTFSVLDPAPSKENINNGSDVGGILIKGPTLRMMDDEVVMTSMLAIAGGGRVVAVVPSKLLG